MAQGHGGCHHGQGYLGLGGCWPQGTPPLTVRSRHIVLTKEAYLQGCFIQNPHFLYEFLQFLRAQQGDDRLASLRGAVVPGVSFRGRAETLRVLSQLRKAFVEKEHVV